MNNKLIVSVAIGTFLASAVCAAPGVKKHGGQGHAPAHRSPAPAAAHRPAPPMHRPAPPMHRPAPIHHVAHHPPVHHHPPHNFHRWRRGPIHAHYRNCWIDGIWYDEIGYAYYAPAGYVYPQAVVAPAPVVVAPAPAPVVVTPPPAPVVVTPPPLIQIQTP